MQEGMLVQSSIMLVRQKLQLLALLKVGFKIRITCQFLICFQARGDGVPESRPVRARWKARTRRF